jgi:hypothetical protein
LERFDLKIIKTHFEQVSLAVVKKILAKPPTQEEISRRRKVASVVGIYHRAAAGAKNK